MQVSCPQHASFNLLTVARRGSCGPTREVDLAPHPVAGLVLQIENVEKFPQALGFESLDPFLSQKKKLNKYVVKVTKLPGR